MSDRRRRRGGGGVAAPVISSAAPVIGTVVTGAPGTTYQWQRNQASPTNIGGATSQNYTPVDADFGYALRQVVNGVPSNWTATVQELPAQSLGSELIATGNMSSSTGWSLGTNITISGGLMHFAATPNGQAGFYDFAVTIYDFFENLYTVSSRSAGSVRAEVMTAQDTSVNTNIIKRGLLQARGSGSGFRLRAVGVSTYDLDDVSCKKITPNGQLATPSADFDLRQLFTVPVSPTTGDKFLLLCRISDMSSGNYLAAQLLYSGTGWDITFNVVAAGLYAPDLTATGVGSINGMRVVASGSTISVYTTVDSGENWSIVSSSFTESTYNSATGANAIWSSPFTAGRLSA